MICTTLQSLLLSVTFSLCGECDLFNRAETKLHRWLLLLEVCQEVNLPSLWCLNHIVLPIVVRVIELGPILFAGHAHTGKQGLVGGTTVKGQRARHRDLLPCHLGIHIHALASGFSVLLSGAANCVRLERPHSPNALAPLQILLL